MDKKNRNQKVDYLSTRSTYNAKTIDFSKINKEKIEDYIELMKEHQMNCVKDGNFIEAELAKQRVIQLKKIAEKKNFKEAQNRQKSDTNKLKNSHNQELRKYNKEFENKFNNEMNKLEEMINELKIRQENELQDYIDTFDKNYPTQIKPSNVFLDLQRQLDYYVKNEDYPNAHLTQIELEEAIKRDKKNYEDEKEKKVEKEISLLRFRQQNEMKAMELKIENHKNALLREQQMKINEINLKYKNKLRDLERKQKSEREAYERIINNIGLNKTTRPLTAKNTSRSMPKNIK
jgi:hypothetical protein